VRIKRVVVPTLLTVLTAALLVQLPMAIAERTNGYEFFDPLLDIRQILINDYVQKPDAKKMQQSAIDGMVNSLDDPYTTYVPPSDKTEFEKQLRGTYVGIGAEVNKQDGYLTIVTPMADSPALHAGIRSGDKVLEIEGESTLDLSIQECIDNLLGEPGTDVHIKVRHENGVEEDITITRQRIVTPTIKGLRRAGEQWTYCIDPKRNIAYIRITQFNSDTVSELRKALETFQSRHDTDVKGLILDVRDNPGGALRTAVEVADLFLAEGEIVSVRGRNDERAFHAGKEDTLPDFPMVVIANGQSASASEIVSGALQDNERAKMLGTRTFGKGSVQEVRELEYGRGTLKFTTAYYYLPSGRNIDRHNDSKVWGVDPNPGYVVQIADDKYIEMLERRREFEVIRNGDDAQQTQRCADAQWIEQHLRDPQLAAAIKAVQARVDGNDWPKVGGENPTQVAFDESLQRTIESRNRLQREVQRLEQRIRELQGLAQEAGHKTVLPEDAQLTDGVIEIRDKDGKVIGRYRIEGGNVELALEGLSLKPLDES